MKKIQFFTQLFVVLAFIALVIILIVSESQRNAKLYVSSVSGEIISFEKRRKGNYSLKFIQQGKLRVLSFKPEGALMISVGDSIFKKSNSNSIYIRKKEKPGLEEVKWKGIHIGGEWEE